MKSLKSGEVCRVRSVTQSVGGKATNAARVLNTLGAEPILFGFNGGNTGKAIEELLNEEGIAHSFVETENETRICQTLLADNVDDFTELVEEGPALSSKVWKTLLQRFQGLEKQSVIISGTLPKHAPVEIYSELIEAAGVPVILDTSGPALMAALKAQPDLVKINASELRKSTGFEDVEQAAQELIAEGAQAVGITNGPKSALLVTRHSTHRFHIPDVNVVSTLGCGDSVNAGISFALQKGSALPEAFIFGLACGAANAKTALPGVVKHDHISEIAQKIKKDL
jgi:1-phosphofructokinase family hexose kinase